jgi:hypothetical protein
VLCGFFITAAVVAAAAATGYGLAAAALLQLRQSCAS